ncbi:S24 family peptidase [Pseudomonas baltica]|uniref:XRE family transcriptional regulator n=1 Tax=Pseudomonas baltica TaxID=2762576 RepID=UPI00289D8325|nr:S24 family peptidase [Pseudomonas baltica]
MELKDRLKHARKMANLTQVELAERAGIKQASVSEIERGLSRTSGYLVKIAQICGVSPVWLAEGVGPVDSVGNPAVTESQAGKVTPGASAADLVKEMLAKSGKGIAEETRARLLAAADESQTDFLPSEYSSLHPRNEEIVIPQYDIRAAMGDGQVPPDYTEVVRNLVVREELLREKGVTYTSASALAMINGWGQSMEGTINDKDLVIVDRGVKDFIGEGIYVMTWHQELYIKRVMRLDEENYRLISDNKHYENQTARIDDVTIHAKVLYIWNGRKA